MVRTGDFELRSSFSFLAAAISVRLSYGVPTGLTLAQEIPSTPNLGDWGSGVQISPLRPILSQLRGAAFYIFWARGFTFARHDRSPCERARVRRSDPPRAYDLSTRESGYGIGGIPSTIAEMTSEKMIVFKR